MPGGFSPRCASGRPTTTITLISAEPFYRHVAGDAELSVAADYWPARRAYIAGLRDMFGEAEIVVVFRRQADYALSLYQEHVKVTRYKGRFREFLDEFWFHFVFLQQVEAWAAGFGGVRAMTFERLVAAGDPVAEFCRLLELPVEGLPPAERHNEALPLDMVILKRLLHAGPGDKDEIRARLEALAARIPPEVFEAVAPRSLFGSAKARAKFQDGFAAGNDGLRPYLLHQVPADEPVFPAAFRDGGSFGDQPQPAVLGAVVDLALAAPESRAPADSDAAR